MATLLKIVEPKWIALPSDSRGNRFKRFRLIVNAERDVVVEEKIRRTVRESVRTELPSLRFSAGQRRAGEAQLNAAFIWQSFNAQGFGQRPPSFFELPPNEEASALSED